MSRSISYPKFHVIVADYLVDDLRFERDILDDIARVSALNAYTQDDLMDRIDDADAVMLFHNVAILAETIVRLKRCKLITRCGVGVDNVDLEFARECGIPVANVPDYGTQDVADSAIGMMLALTRGLHRLNSMGRQAKATSAWSHEAVAPLRRLRGQVLGVVGLGRIGTATAQRGVALGMTVIFFDPYLPDGHQNATGLRRVATLRELIANSYVVSLHCPLNRDNEQMINSESIEWFQPGSFIVNTARGRLVDTSLIPPALASGRLAGAAIDVLPTEPPSDDDPLIVAWRDPNHAAYHRLIVNPHAAFYSEEGLVDMRVKAARNCRRALLGEPILNVVNGVHGSDDPAIS